MQWKIFFLSSLWCQNNHFPAQQLISGQVLLTCESRRGKKNYIYFRGRAGNESEATKTLCVGPSFASSPCTLDLNLQHVGLHCEKNPGNLCMSGVMEAPGTLWRCFINGNVLRGMFVSVCLSGWSLVTVPDVGGKCKAAPQHFDTAFWQLVVCLFLHCLKKKMKKGKSVP